MSGSPAVRAIARDVGLLVDGQDASFGNKVHLAMTAAGLGSAEVAGGGARGSR